MKGKYKVTGFGRFTIFVGIFLSISYLGGIHNRADLNLHEIKEQFMAGWNSVSTENMTTVKMEDVKELKNDIEDLREEIEDLENKLDEKKDLLHELNLELREV